jgi:hypothetical protein
MFKSTFLRHVRVFLYLSPCVPLSEQQHRKRGFDIFIRRGGIFLEEGLSPLLDAPVSRNGVEDRII